MQSAVEKEVKKLIDEGHREELAEVGEDTFVSPVVITHKNDGTVKNALDSTELNKQIIKKTMQLPLLAELLDQICMKISANRKATPYISTIDLKYSFGQIALHKETSKHCVAAIVGGKATGHYRFKKGFYGLADMPVVFQTKIDKDLNYETPAWQDDIKVVTRATALQTNIKQNWQPRCKNYKNTGTVQQPKNLNSFNHPLNGVDTYLTTTALAPNKVERKP